MQTSTRLAAALLVLGALGAGLGAQELSAADRARKTQQQRCFAQQRILSGFVQLVELRRGQRVTSLPWETLLRNPALKRLARDPGDPRPATSHRNYQLSAGAPLGLLCTRHGHEPATAPSVVVDQAPAPRPPVVREVGFLGL